MRMIIAIIIQSIVVICAQTKPIQSNDIPVGNQGEKTNEEFTQVLFGERGILTGVFRMMDQQRKIQNVPQSDTADNGKIGKFDFKKIVDSLLTGADKGELGDHGTELPEFLGICNRLSCGDIYKAIDKFRKSDMFSNFQTALTLVQDPNGWETIGKLLSNPELISQFTAGSGMEELFGSALGEAEKTSSMTKTKNSKLMPEDGDFGIDFSEDGENSNVTVTENKPGVDFSVDNKGATEDYYGEVMKAGDLSNEYEFVDETPPPSTQIKKAENLPEEKMPEISFSIDGNDGDEMIESVQTAELPPDIKVAKKIHAGGVVDIGVSKQKVTVPTTTTTRNIPLTSPVTQITTTRATRATTTTTARPTTTMRNFRKDNDYYAMYYDDNNENL